ncbi:MAG: RNA 2',3'-cyclic phosphodiesterase [Armatimonadetes bacterium]|nr:RNA 2',3'-cyclic phosphodiesterase [Armatimonadota bacterium]
MRLFFGLPVDENVRNRVLTVQDRLRSVAGKVKWVESANLHFTLRFLGETADGEVERVAQAAEGIRGLPVGLALRDVGAFPGPGRARVIWVGLARGGETLAQISRELDARLEAKLGLAAEPRGFTPHLTIGRVKAPAPNEALSRSLEALRDEEFGEFTAERFMLYRSTLRPEGPVYHVLREYGA